MTNSESAGPGCVGGLFITVIGWLVIGMLVLSEVRFYRIETRLGLPHCGIFNAATGDGKTCKEAVK